MAPFRLGHDEFQHELPWLLLQNGPVTKYWRHEYFEEDIAELLVHGYLVPRFDCATWADEEDMHRDLKAGLGLPGYTGSGFDALADSLTDIEVPDASGVMVALDNFHGVQRATSFLRSWLLQQDGGCSSDVGSAFSCAPTNAPTKGR